MEEEERKEGEKRERWKEMFEGRGHERKRRSGDRMVTEGDTVMQGGRKGKDSNKESKKEGKEN